MNTKNSKSNSKSRKKYKKTPVSTNRASLDFYHSNPVSKRHSDAFVGNDHSHIDYSSVKNVPQYKKDYKKEY